MHFYQKKTHIISVNFDCENTTLDSKKQDDELKCRLFRTGYDLILKGFAQVTEVIGIASHTHDQVTVLIRVFFRSSQCGGIYHIELDVMTIQLEVCTYQLH